MTRWLVTGARGMLGRDLVTVLEHRGEVVTGLSRADLDITDTRAVGDALARWRPDVVVNCAAWTAVDDAEASEDAALRVNGEAVGGVAACCASQGAALVQVSTDYVFDGLGREPYPEDGRPVPRTAYGRTKLAGERAVLEQPGLAGYVVRTAWLYGAHGPSFVATMIRKEREPGPVQVVDDQCGQPTWSADVADRIHALITSAAAARHLPRDQQRRDDLVRARPGGLPAPGRGSGPRPAVGEQRAGPPGAAARLQRPRPRRLGAGRAHADR